MSGERDKQIRVLVVEDSAVARELLVHVLDADPQLRVVGTASNGAEAVEAVRRDRPDVVTMDYDLPKMNGMEATRRIMETHPVPIVIVSGLSARGEDVDAFRLLEAGALAVIEKTAGIGHPGHAAAAREMVQTVKLMSEVKVVRRWPKRATEVADVPAGWATGMKPVATEIKLVAIGASTGGPIVIKTILSALPKDFGVPILIVQHIAPGFTQGMVSWLAQATGFAVHVAAAGDSPRPGNAYVAPDGRHMTLARDGRIALSSEPRENGHRPSVSLLFRSVAAALGPNAIGVLLTGMGSDGSRELKLMKDQGAVTIAQDQETSVVHGMPGEAIQLGAAAHVLAAGTIPDALKTLVSRRNSK